ncbi:Uncharacterised protein [Mycobacteroides abscessus subsp. abscessus]|nr:Uncharacterised protein [Mycobacteroides abscessus subsp. abscessus]
MTDTPTIDVRPAYGAALNALERLATKAAADPVTPDTYAGAIGALTNTVAVLQPIVAEQERRDRAAQADAAATAGHDNHLHYTAGGYR